MNANELADILQQSDFLAMDFAEDAATMLRQQQEKLTKYELRHAEQRKRIDELEAYQKHDVELAEAIGWDKGYEAGRQLGMKQERALWELAASTQEIMDTHPVKEQDESFDRTASHMAGEYVSYQKELTDEEIGYFTHRMVLCCGVNPNSADINVLGLKFIVEDILRKAQEK
jgi:hypothetical protein